MKEAVGRKRERPELVCFVGFRVFLVCIFTFLVLSGVASAFLVSFVGFLRLALGSCVPRMSFFSGLSLGPYIPDLRVLYPSPECL